MTTGSSPDSGALSRRIAPERVPALLCYLASLTLLGMALGADMLPSAAPGMGPSQILALVAAAGAAGAGLALRTPAGRRAAAALRVPAAIPIESALGFFGITAQLAGIVFVLRSFHIESPALYDTIGPLLLAGFVVHHLAPAAFRSLVFVLLCAVAAWRIFGVSGAAWLFGIGLALITICRLPIRFGARVALLVLAGALLAVMRAGGLPSPWPVAIWPILGSLFMFRLIVYMYDLRHATSPPETGRTLAYFFLLPNLVFPLFPVVDYATFRRNYYDQPALRIYQAGVRWMLTGLVHLLGYRIVYQYFSLPATAVSSPAELAQHVIATFLLYLKVSGQFHFIVGTLHLFGYRLPRTHRFFYLASSFTDLWRRINIYWKDFMMKVVYYPAFFRLRKRGDTFALVTSTVIVFLTTWALHSWQWFWLLGEVLLSLPDIAFWSLLAVLLIASTLREAKKGRARRIGVHLPSLRESLRAAAGTVRTFTLIALMWSLWSAPTFGDWFAMWQRANIGVTALGVWAVASFAALVLLAAGGWSLPRLRPAAAGRTPAPQAAPRFARSMATTTALVALLLALGSARPMGMGDAAVAFVRDLRVDKLNAADAELLHRGYYENLTGVNQFNSKLWEAYAKRPTDWQTIWQTDVVEDRGDFLFWDVAPLVGTVFNGTTIRTNRWGMRDRDYEQAPAAGTYRIALLGASFVMGQGVNDHEVFEALAENRLNREFTAGPAEHYEILNFSVPNFSPVQQLVYLEDKVFGFQPDAVLIIGHPFDSQNFARHMARAFRTGRTLPDPFFVDIIARAGIDRAMSIDDATARLESFRPDVIRWTFAKTVEACRARGILPVWVYTTTPDVKVPQEQIDYLIAAARDAGFLMFDIADAFAGHEPETLRVAPWDSHPNALAHRLLADRLYDVLTDEGRAWALGQDSLGPGYTGVAR